MDESGEVVQPGVPAFLPPQLPAERRLTRLDLANWLVARENPLTARVFVNRLWKLFFGAGLSRKLDDLGAQGEWPTHPELLDWLAAEFIDSGWDVKHVVRSIVLSETYRQASRTARTCASAIRTTCCWPGRRGFGSMPRWSATTRWRSAACWSSESAGRASSRISPPATGPT